MSLHRDLVLQALALATDSKGKPRQASLRRAVSAAYYSLFHLLVFEGTARLLGRKRATLELRQCLARAFLHAEMHVVAKQFGEGKPSPKLSRAITSVPPDLALVAKTFVDLQQMRHEADYDLGRVFSRSEVMRAIFTCVTAHLAFERVKKDPETLVFLTALLAQKAMKA